MPAEILNDAALDVVPDRSHGIAFAELDRGQARTFLRPRLAHDAELALHPVRAVRVQYGTAVVEAIHAASFHVEDEVIFLASAPVETRHLGARVPYGINGAGKRKELALLRQEHPALTEEEWFQDVSAAVEESGEFSVYF